MAEVCEWGATVMDDGAGAGSKERETKCIRNKFATRRGERKKMDRAKVCRKGGVK